MTNALLTAYCACRLCCGPQAAGITASGHKPVEGITIAAPRSVKLGTVVVVTAPGVFTNRVFRVQDRTARRYDGRWDVFYRSHENAKRFGIRRGTVIRYAPPTALPSLR